MTESASKVLTDPKVSKAPVDINIDSIVVDISFHPARDAIAAGTIDGEVKIYSYSVHATNHELMTLDHHKKSCRALCFSEDGTLLFSASKDKSLQVVDMNTGSVTSKMMNAHKSPIYSLLVIDNYLIATGDDDGYFKLWDYRRETAIMEAKNSEEFISDLTTNSEKKVVLATSGEGTLTAFNIRAKRMELQSELFESEFLSMAVVKNENKVAVGTGEGAINIFNWGEWGNISDRFPGHPMSIDSMVAISDDIICTGSMDGVIRAVHVLPNRFLGIVGNHDEFPVENMSLSKDGKLLASCSHDQKIKFWNISCLDDIEEDPNVKPKHKNKKKKLASTRQADFFAGLAD
ncbi:WD repeat-containing protein 55 [Tachypleus tridentatus]|uniref:WD repeat-containing protein 55 n=1 Tax=Tachypleus tridentatus TaxID=6853 RepID=UPI003FD26D81